MTRKEWEPIRFLALHLACGLAAALVLGSAILILDLSNIRTMAFDQPHGGIVIMLLFFGLAITFGGAAMAAGIMGLGDYSGPPDSMDDPE